MHKLEIKNFSVKIEDKQILNNVNLTINSGEVHAIMGPNGTGKSTLASAIMGAPQYEVTSGEVLLDGVNILEMPVDERARQGLFLAMQNPVEVPGVTNSTFMREALSAKLGKRVNLIDFALDYEDKSKELEMRPDLPHRYLNQGFSGGEKKRNEVLQLKVLKPKFAMLDEIDSGLDVDALRIVGTNISEMIGPDMGVLLITHYQRILEYIKPTFVHVIVGGTIVKTGGLEIIKEIETNGYQNFSGDDK
jgi:Fe-S cluster assembly ATP-binding protein